MKHLEFLTGALVSIVCMCTLGCVILKWKGEFGQMKPGKRQLQKQVVKVSTISILSLSSTCYFKEVASVIVFLNNQGFQ